MLRSLLSPQDQASMPQYLYSASKPGVDKFTDRVTAPNLDAARYALELRGCRDIVFHTDDLAALYVKEPEPGEEPVEDVLSPEEELASRRQGGIWNSLVFAWKMNSLFWVPLAIWLTITLVNGRPYGWGDWLGFILDGIFVIYFVRMVLPGVAYQHLLESSVWHNWSRVRLMVYVLRELTDFVRITKMGQLELDIRQACAMAAGGDREGALKLVQRNESAAPDKALYYGRVAEVYSIMKDYSGMIEVRKKALELSNNRIAEVIDYALSHVRSLRDYNTAETTLEKLGDQELSEIPLLFVVYCRSLIHLEKKEYPQAEKGLRKVIKLCAPYSSGAIIWGMLKEVKAYLLIALANQGKKEEASKLLKEITPLLTARKNTELLQRCHSALGTV